MSTTATAAAPRTRTASTSSAATRVIGIAALVGIAWQVVFGLFLSPDDAIQGTAVRFLYLHVPAVSCAYLGFTCCALSSVVYLRKRTLGWDRFAGASGEVGLLFMAITLLTGALWGKKTWGVYWAWDARLTTTALLFLLFLGYVAVRGLEAAPEIRARRSAIVGIDVLGDQGRDRRPDAVQHVRRVDRLLPRVRVDGDPPASDRSARGGAREQGRRHRHRRTHRRSGGATMNGQVLLGFSTFTDVVFGYLVTFAALALVAWRLVSRGRRLAAQVPDEDKPWI
jgi:hypothetical protein